MRAGSPWCTGSKRALNEVCFIMTPPQSAWKRQVGFGISGIAVRAGWRSGWIMFIKSSERRSYSVLKYAREKKWCDITRVSVVAASDGMPTGHVMYIE